METPPSATATSRIPKPQKAGTTRDAGNENVAPIDHSELQSQNTAQIPVKKPVASQPLYDGFSSDDDSPYKPAVRQPQRAGRRTTKAQGPAGPKPARAITTTSVFDKLGINESGFESDSSAGNSPFQGKGRMVSALEGLPAALSPLPVASPFDQLQGRLARANSTIAALEQEVAVSTHRSEEAMKELQEATEKIQKLEAKLDATEKELNTLKTTTKNTTSTMPDSRHPSTEALRSKAELLERQLSALRASNDRAQTERDDLARSHADLQRKLVDAQSQLDKYVSQGAVPLKELEAVQGLLAGKVEEVAEVQRQRDAYLEQAQKCEHDLVALQTALNDAQQEQKDLVEVLDHRTAAAEERIGELLKMVAEAEMKMEVTENINTRLQSEAAGHAVSIEQAQQAQNVAQAEAETARKQAAEYKGQVEVLKQQAERVEAESQLAEGQLLAARQAYEAAVSDADSARKLADQYKYQAEELKRRVQEAQSQGSEAYKAAVAEAEATRQVAESYRLQAEELEQAVKEANLEAEQAVFQAQDAKKACEVALNDAAKAGQEAEKYQTKAIELENQVGVLKVAAEEQSKHAQQAADAAHAKAATLEEQLSAFQQAQQAAQQGMQRELARVEDLTAQAASLQSALEAATAETQRAQQAQLAAEKALETSHQEIAIVISQLEASSSSSSEVVAQQAAAAEKLAVATSQLTSLQAELQAATAAAEAANQRVQHMEDEMESLNARYMEVSQQLVAAQEQLAAVEESAAAEAAALRDDLVDLNEALSQAQSQAQEALSSKSVVETELLAAQKKLDEAVSAKESITARLQQVEKVLAAERGLRSKAETDLAQRDAAVHAASEEADLNRAALEQAQQNVMEHQARLMEVASQFREMEEKAAAQQAQHAAELAAAQAAAGFVEELQRNLDSVHTELSQEQQNVKSLNNALTQLQSEHATVTDQLHNQFTQAELLTTQVSSLQEGLVSERAKNDCLTAQVADLQANSLHAATERGLQTPLAPLEPSCVEGLLEDVLLRTNQESNAKGLCGRRKSGDDGVDLEAGGVGQTVGRLFYDSDATENGDDFFGGLLGTSSKSGNRSTTALLRLKTFARRHSTVLMTVGSGYLVLMHVVLLMVLHLGRTVV